MTMTATTEDIMTNHGSANAMRDLSACEMAEVAGGAIDLDFEFLGLRIFLRTGDGWGYMCVANQSTYNCTTSVGGQTYTSGAQAGPVQDWARRRRLR
jgi:hypothetical protein